MKNQFRVYLTLVCVLLFVFFGCKKSNPVNAEEKISVVAATFPCYDAARAVLGSFAGADVSLKLLVKPGTEVHSYDPTPQDIISIQNSDLFIYVGGESDNWVEKLIKSSKAEMKTTELKLIDCVKVLEEVEFVDGKAVSESEEEADYEADEHIWTSPENELKIVNAVCEKLSKIFEAKGKSEAVEILDENAEKYCAKINAVEEKTKNIINKSSMPYIVVADRFPFAYFADYYGLEYSAAFNGCSTAVEASTATISHLIDFTKQNKIPAVFYIELGNHKIADIVSEGAGVNSLLLQSCQNVTKADFDKGETWVTLMEENAENLTKGLKI